MRIVCTCGAPVDWEALPVHGRQPVPTDPELCACGLSAGEEGPHAESCEAPGYVLVYKNCPQCQTTMCEKEK